MLDRLLDRFDRGAIIMYHRVADVPHDPWALAVAPDHFAAQLAALKRSCTVLPMPELVAALAAGRLPRRAVAITFDDGYHDNLSHAAPILADAGLPATLFLSTGPMAAGERYWFEELAELILDAPDAARVSVTIGDTPREIVLGAREPLDDERGDWRGWDAPRTVRERVFVDLWNELRVLEPGMQDAALDALAAALGIAPPRAARPMNESEVREIAKGPFALGGHTADHADLLALDNAAALAQIARGKAATEAVGGAPIAGFAYPFGRCDARVGRLVREAGFDWACTTEHAHVRRRGARPDRMFLPRIQAEDVGDIGWLG